MNHLSLTLVLCDLDHLRQVAVGTQKQMVQITQYER